MKFLLGVVLCFTLFDHSTGFAQAGDSRAIAAKRDANRFTSALLKKEYPAFVDLLYQPFVDSMGGKKKFIENVKESMRRSAEAGDYPESFVVSDAVELVTNGDHLAVTLPFVLSLHEHGKSTPSPNNGFLIGVSLDAGNTWGFLDATNMQTADLKIFLPEFSNKLTIFQKPLLITPHR